MAENQGFYPAQASSIRKGGYILIRDRPCKVIEMSTSKTGKHGHAKINFTGIDIFTEKKNGGNMSKYSQYKCSRSKKKRISIIGYFRRWIFDVI